MNLFQSFLYNIDMGSMIIAVFVVKIHNKKRHSDTMSILWTH